MAKLSPFEFINSINNKTPMEKELLTEYTPFIVNKGLSYYADCLLYVNEMNRYHFLSKDQQYRFLYGTIKKGKRFTKWIKKDESEILDTVCKYYQVNARRGTELLNLLTDEQKDDLVEIMSHGGSLRKKNITK